MTCENLIEKSLGLLRRMAGGDEFRGIVLCKELSIKPRTLSSYIDQLRSQGAEIERGWSADRGETYRMVRFPEQLRESLAAHDSEIAALRLRAEKAEKDISRFTFFVGELRGACEASEKHFQIEGVRVARVHWMPPSVQKHLQRLMDDYELPAAPSTPTPTEKATP